MSSSQGRRPARSTRAAGPRGRRPPDADDPPLTGLGGAVVLINPAGNRHQRLPGQPQGPRIRELRLGRAGDRARVQRDLAAPVRSAVQPQRADALDVQTQVNAERADAEQLVQRAEGTDHPDELNGANGWLVETLKFRADAIAKIAASLPEALGGERGQSSDAINSIAGQMQAFLASDVIYLQRTIPDLTSAYDKQRDRGALPDRPVPAGPRLARPGDRGDAAEPESGGPARRPRRACTARASRA